jgi:hypothetical protein
MSRPARVLVVAFALAMTGAEHDHERLLSCHGSFGRFVNGFLVDKPSELNFIVDWLAPKIMTEGGRPGVVTALTATELAFEVQYDGYKAHYRISRIDGAIRQAVSLGAVFYGLCELKPLETKF